METPQEGTLGVVGGSSLLRSALFAHFRPAVITTRFGRCAVLLPPGTEVAVEGAQEQGETATLRVLWPERSASADIAQVETEKAGDELDGALRAAVAAGTQTLQRLVFIQRHHADPERPYAPPHLINKRAIVEALVLLGCDRVLSFASVGTLQPHIPIGTIMLADDFFHFPGSALSRFEDDRGHFVPHLTPSRLHSRICKLLDEKSIAYLPRGTYAQANGPRFETKAEIRFLATAADVVGMTAAEEVTLLLEAKMDCALLCVVDNAANGVVFDESAVTHQLSMIDFHSGVKRNQVTVDAMTSYVLESLAGAQPFPS